MITNHLSHRTPSLSILPLSPYITLLFETLQDIVEHAAIMVLSAISTPFKIVVRQPIQTCVPMCIGLGRFIISSS